MRVVPGYIDFAVLAVPHGDLRVVDASKQVTRRLVRLRDFICKSKSDPFDLSRNS
jgi:hypothetical protein